jgi:hypothetical protein
MNATIAGPPPLTVQWRCRRCGHVGGMAQTRVPVLGWSEPMVREGLAALRVKLVRLHFQQQHCAAVVEDFVIESYVSPAHTLVDRI